MTRCAKVAKTSVNKRGKEERRETIVRCVRKGEPNGRASERAAEGGKNRVRGGHIRTIRQKPTGNGRR